MSKCALRSTAGGEGLEGTAAATRTTTLVRLVYALAMSLFRKFRRNEPVGRWTERSTRRSSRVERASSTISPHASETYVSASSTPGVPTTRTPMSSASARAHGPAREPRRTARGRRQGGGGGRLNSTLQRATSIIVATHETHTSGWIAARASRDAFLETRRFGASPGVEATPCLLRMIVANRTLRARGVKPGRSVPTRFDRSAASDDEVVFI